MLELSQYVIEESDEGLKYLSMHDEIMYSLKETAPSQWVFELFRQSGSPLPLSPIISVSALEAEVMARFAIEQHAESLNDKPIKKPLQV